MQLLDASIRSDPVCDSGQRLRTSIWRRAEEAVAWYRQRIEPGRRR